jgi:hypothetical protein
VAVPPAISRTTADPHDPAGFRIAHSLFHPLIIMSKGSILRRGAPGLPWSFPLCQLQLPITQVLQRSVDAKPSQWLSFRPSPTVLTKIAGSTQGNNDAFTGYLPALRVSSASTKR